MRGKDGQWVRPHPGPFVWNHIESEKGKFFWEDVDKYVGTQPNNFSNYLASYKLGSKIL